MAESELDTVTASLKQFQQTLTVMGERLDQVAAMYQARLQETQSLHNEMAATIRVFQDVIGNLDKTAADMARATAALIEIERRWALRLAQQEQQS